ncbi:MAG TPA: hypothetical protein VFE37_16895 [Chloroflexota bacterium]|nr:hypothetical protein [Chloroflexota bacterium]
MARVTVEAFVWDDRNLDEIARHGLRFWEVDEVLLGPYRVDPNRPGRRASHLLIGRTENGECVAVPIEPTADRAIWRPVTAWRCKRSEWARLAQMRHWR